MSDERKKPNYLIFTSDVAYNIIPYLRIRGRGDILWSTSLPLNRSGIAKKICKIHLSRSVAKKIKLPFQSLWFPKFVDFQRNDFSALKCVLFYESSRLSTNEAYVRYLRALLPGVPFCFFYTNLIDKKDAAFRGWVERMYDRVFVYNKSPLIDNKKIFYLEGTYTPMPLKEERCVNDVFFVGMNKGRAEEIHRIYRACMDKGLKCDFTVIGVPEQERIEGINYTRKLSYEEVLQHIAQCRCILELFSEDAGVTLRTMEAICYHKKLMTNNPACTALDFYQSGNALLLRAGEPIDADFVRSAWNDGGAYETEFSFDSFLHRLDALL